MATYKQAGVNAPLMDLCSEMAYEAAVKTFPGREKAKIGRPLLMKGGFSGAIDMGGFYLVQNDDTVGTKMMIAEKLGIYDTIGYDLAAMVADDAVCVGAETISISNTIMTPALSKTVVSQMMRGFGKACRQQKIIIPGGEIAILKDVMKGWEWGATAMGVVEKKKFITGDDIKLGDMIIGLYSPNFRSNGFTLIRYILEKCFGKKWDQKKFGKKTWGEITLEPSIIYHDAALSLIGRYGEKAKVKIKGIAHITGGGIPGNAPRVFGKKKFGMIFDRLFDPPEAMRELQRLGRVSDQEAYETWNMGVGMILVTGPKEAEKTLELLKKQKVRCGIIGKVVPGNGVTLASRGSNSLGKILRFA